MSGRAGTNFDSQPERQISTANAPDGAMHVLIRDTYGIIWHGREKEQGLGWNWKSHSGDANKDISQLGHFELVCHARDGRMVALAVGTDKAIWDYWYRPEDESLPWSWKSLGGITGRDVRICERRTGGLEAFIVDPCNRLWHRWTTPDHAWCQKWSIMGGRIIGNVAVAELKAFHRYLQEDLMAGFGYEGIATTASGTAGPP